MSRSDQNGNLQSGGQIPDPRDEDEVEEQFYGRNETRGVVVDGWTGGIPRRFVGAKDKLAVQTIPYDEMFDKFEHFNWRPDKKRFARKISGDLCNLLEDMRKLIRRGPWKISEPIVVQVLEKKCIHVVRKSGGVFLIGVAIVGDDTGYCNLTTVNGAIEYLYKKIQVGDHLILRDGHAQSPKFATSDNISLNNNKALEVEIKIREFEAKKLFVIEAPNPPKLLAGLFTEKTTWRPSELWNANESVFEFPQNLNQKAINICGVISYVGQISRIRWNSNEDSSPYSKKQYACFRWIQIVDSTVPKALSLRILINSLNFENQCMIVPGTAIVVTNVISMREKVDYFEFYLETSHFSRVFVNDEIMGYLRPLPRSNRDIVKEVVSPSNSSAILKRKDILWGAGGTLFMQIVDPGKFLTFYSDLSSSDELTSSHISGTSLARREVERIYAKGNIRKIFKIYRNSKNQLCNRLYWVSDSGLNERVCNNQKMVETIHPFSEKHWFPFVRQFPAMDHVIDTNRAKHGFFLPFEKNLIAYKEICSALLLPAKYSEQDGTKLKDFPMADGGRCFIFYVFDPYLNIEYSCIWKSIPFEEMEIRVNEFIHTKSLLDTQNTQEKKDKSLSSAEDDSEHETTCRTNKTVDTSIIMTEKRTDSDASLPSIPSKKCDAHFIIDLYEIEDPAPDNLVINVVDFVIN